MANRFTVWTDFRVGQDQLGRTIKKNKRGLNSLQSAALAAGAAFTGFLGAQAVTAGLSAASMGIREVTTQFMEFDHAATGAAARWGDSFDRGTEGFNRISAAARETGATTEHTSAQAASGLSFMAMAGFDAASSMELLPDIANLATAANLDFAQSADFASDALGAFGMAEGDAAQKGAAFEKIVDQASKTVNTSNQTLVEWFEAIREGGPPMVATSQKMSTLNTVLAALAESGKKGATSGYMMRTAMTRLAAPTQKAQRIMRGLGVEVEKDGKFRDFLDILGDLETGMEGLSDARRAAAIKEIFGMRSVAGMNILLQKGSTALKEHRDRIIDSAGATQTLADKMRGSLQNRLKKIQSAAIEVGFKIFDAFGPKIEGAIESVSEYLDDLNEDASPLVDTFTDIGKAIGTSAKFLYENKEIILDTVKALAYLKAAMMVSNTVGGFTSLIGGLSGGLVTMTGSAAAANAGILTMNVTLGSTMAMLGPLTAALGGALALGFAINDQLDRFEERKLKKSNKNTAISVSASKDIAQGNVHDIEQGENALLAKVGGEKRFKEIEFAISKGRGVQSDELKADIEWIQRARRRKAQELEKMRTGAGHFLFEGEEERMSRFGQNAFFSGGSQQSTRSETVTRNESTTTVKLDASGLPDGMTATMQNDNGDMK